MYICLYIIIISIIIIIILIILLQKRKVETKGRVLDAGVLKMIKLNKHTCHNLPPSEIDGGCFGLCLQAQKGDTYFTELAERAEYGNCDKAMRKSDC